MRSIPIVISLGFMFCLLTQITAQSIKGNGKITVREHQVQPFTQLELSGVFSAVIAQGNEEKVVIETDENLQEYIEISNRGGRLIVEMPDKRFKFNGSKKILVTVYLKSIDELESSIVGSLKTKPLKLNTLKFKNSSVGNVELDVTADLLDADMSIVGNVVMRGSVKRAEIDNACVGKLEAFDLHAEILEIDNSSVGQTEIYAKKELYIESSGVGNLYYKGDADIKRLDSSGLGKVKKL